MQERECSTQGGEMYPRDPISIWVVHFGFFREFFFLLMVVGASHGSIMLDRKHSKGSVCGFLHTHTHTQGIGNVAHCNTVAGG